MSNHQELAAQARAICSQLRTKSMPLADLIPLMQKMADALDSNEPPLGWVSAYTDWAGMPRLKIHDTPKEGAKPVWLSLKHSNAITPEVKELAKVVLREMPTEAKTDWQLCARAVCNAVKDAAA